MIITAYRIETILKNYTKQVMPQRDSGEPLHLKAMKEDSVAISDEGRRRIMEKFKNDILEQLTRK